MPTFESQPLYEHEQPDALGVLVVNLGTPDAPTTAAVRRYLRQFLWDPRVVDYPRALWWLILNGVILVLRPSKSAHAYQQVWTKRGSPLLFNSQDIATAMQTQLSAQLSGNVQVELAMTYGNPSIEAGLNKLHAAGARRIVVLPLYPQYSGTTTAAVFDAVVRELGQYRWVPESRFINSYHDTPGYISALASSIHESWAEHGRGDKLLMSFHGVPKKTVDNGDPYLYHCRTTAELLAHELGLSDNDWMLAFQSRVGRDEWLSPYTDKTVTELGRQGLSRLDVVCPGFSTDCLETLEEIAMQNAEFFTAAGGGTLHYIGALNAREDHAQFLAELIQENIRGWTIGADA
jgi:ferrochelatase